MAIPLSQLKAVDPIPQPLRLSAIGITGWRRVTVSEFTHRCRKLTVSSRCSSDAYRQSTRPGCQYRRSAYPGLG